MKVEACHGSIIRFVGETTKYYVRQNGGHQKGGQVSLKNLDTDEFEFDRRLTMKALNKMRIAEIDDIIVRWEVEIVNARGDIEHGDIPNDKYCPTYKDAVLWYQNNLNHYWKVVNPLPEKVVSIRDLRAAKQ